MAKTIPWDKVRAVYVASETITHAELAHQFGTSLDSVKKRASKEKWAEQRHSVCTQIALKTEEKTIEKISDDRSEVNRVHYEMWGSVIAKLQDALKAALELDEIETITKALDRAQKGQRLAKDMVTDKTSQEVTGSMSVSNISSDQAKRMAREVLEDGS